RRRSAWRPCVSTRAAAWASSSASVAVTTSPFASPRTPSVPKRRGMARTGDLPLRELRGLAGLLRAGLLALDDARVAREEARLLQCRAVVLTVYLAERAGDREPEGAGLARRPAAGDAGDHVVAAGEVEHAERVVDELLVQLVREELLEPAPVHGE